MKKHILLFLLIIVQYSAIAQITIGQSDMPSPNDTIRYCNASTNFNFITSSTGANYSWNFAGLAEISQGLYEYKSSLNTLYFFYFFNKTGLKTADTIGVSSISLTDIYTFYTTNSGVFKVEGLGYSYSGIPLANSYVDEDEIYQFPLQYGDHDSSTYYFDYNLSQYTTYIDYAQNGSRVNDVDGWGSITIPNAIYPNVLRVKTTITSYDTITVLGFPLITNRTTVEYKWLSNSEKIPVLEISGTLNGNTYTINSIRYRHHPAPASVNNPDQSDFSQFNIYPNPAGDQVIIKTKRNEAGLITIKDAAGRTVMEQQISGALNQINTGSLQAGIYFIQISDLDKNIIGNEKLIIE